MKISSVCQSPIFRDVPWKANLDKMRLTNEKWRVSPLLHVEGQQKTALSSRSLSNNLFTAVLKKVLPSVKAYATLPVGVIWRF